MSTSLSAHNGCVSMFRKYGGAVTSFGVNSVENNLSNKNKNSVLPGKKSKKPLAKGRNEVHPPSLALFAREQRQLIGRPSPSTSKSAPRMKLLSVEYRLDDLRDVARDPSLNLFQRLDSAVCTKVQAIPGCKGTKTPSGPSSLEYGIPEHLLLAELATEGDWIDLGDEYCNNEEEDGWEHVTTAHSFDGLSSREMSSLEPLSYAKAAQSVQEWPCTEPMRRSVFHKETPQSLTNLPVLEAGPEDYFQQDWEDAKFRGARLHQLRASHKKKKRQRNQEEHKV